MSVARSPFVIMAKPVGSRCNMRCAYCYYLDKGKYATRENVEIMDLSVLERLIRKAMEDCPGDVISFVWHGGEPTLAGLSFYEKVVALEKQYLPKGKEVWNNLQTNAMLIDEKWAAFLSANGFDVGVSLDGTELLHNKNRKDAGGNDTYARTIRGIEHLRAAGIRPDLLCTVNADTAQEPLAVYRSLRDLHTGWIQFIPIVNRDESGQVLPESVTPEGYGRFLKEIFLEWITHDLGSTDVQLFAETATILAGGAPGVCTMTPTCGRALIVEADGSIYSCDHFVDDAHRLGNIRKADLQSAVDGPFQTAFGSSKKTNLSDTCKSCPYLPICSGGCPKDRFAADGSYYLCAGLKEYFETAVPDLKKAMIFSRKSYSNAEMMERFRTRHEINA